MRKMRPYIFRILSQMGELPIVRTEGYMKETAQTQRSPLRYFLSQNRFGWAIYLSMFAILLFMVFTARRTATGNTCHTGTGKQIP